MIKAILAAAVLSFSLSAAADELQDLTKFDPKKKPAPSHAAEINIKTEYLVSVATNNVAVNLFASDLHEMYFALPTVQIYNW